MRTAASFLNRTSTQDRGARSGQGSKTARGRRGPPPSSLTASTPRYNGKSKQSRPALFAPFSAPRSFCPTLRQDAAGASIRGAIGLLIHNQLKTNTCRGDKSCPKDDRDGDDHGFTQRRDTHVGVCRPGITGQQIQAQVAPRLESWCSYSSTRTSLSTHQGPARRTPRRLSRRPDVHKPARQLRRPKPAPRSSRWRCSARQP